MLSRLLDAGFDISLSLRGVVPGGTVAVAEQQYRAMLTERPAPAYYGRVVREGGYIACHYLFFYVMNDFRSTFFGVNDHEADWEQVIVYLTEPGPGGGPSRCCPGWPAPRTTCSAPTCAAGTTTRSCGWSTGGIRWCTSAPGRTPATSPRANTCSRCAPSRSAGRCGSRSARQVWRESLGQGLSDPSVPDWSEAFAVPFIDYARGDGPRVGPGTDTPWDPVPLRGDEPWLDGYRGLWGLDTGDPFGGERAPAGPRYNRDGSVRGSWSDVLGFAGLDRVVPEPQLAAHLVARVRRLRFDLREAEQQVRLVRERLRDVELEHAATRQGSAGAVAAENTALALAEAESALAAALSRRDHLVESDRSTAELLHRVEAGCPTDPRTHIRHRHEPEPTTDTPRWLAELWAASSGGLLLLVVAMVLVLPTPHKLAALLAAVVLFLGLDATMRGRGLQFLLGYTVVAAVVAGAVLVVTYWQWSILLTIVLLVVAVVRGNLQELRFLRAAPNRERERAAAGDDAGHISS